MTTLSNQPAAACRPPAHVIAFPTSRARAPFDLLDKGAWDRSFLAAHVAAQYREAAPEKAAARLADLAATRGKAGIARMLEENAGALALLRGVVASLVESDRRIAAAADQLLRAEGL